ncbi:MAG TPA: RNA polymerase sigma factor [Terriglobia bacterium]|nr:RNA polymerase sigma factor [Terriglobia bacterium]
MRPRESSEVPTTLARASDADLVARAQRGEEAAFASLFEAHHRAVYALCLRMTHSPADAEDMTQEAFLRAFRRITTFRGYAAFSSWLYRLTFNEVLMRLRKKRPALLSMDDVGTSQAEPVAREYRHDDQRLIGAIDRINLNRAIADLPPGYRAAFILHDLEGYEHHEIARMKNWSVGNSKSQLHKARRKLREWLRRRGRKTSSAKRAEENSECGLKRSPASRDRARTREMGGLEPGILTH